MTVRRCRRRLAAGVLLAALLALGGATARAAAVVTFRVELGGAAVPTAFAYELQPLDQKKSLYSLKITRRLSTDTSWTNALQSGTVFNPAIVRTVDASFTVLNTYSLANAAVTSVRQFGLASESFVTEEITLVGSPLTVTTP
jgi:hypothetical protein